MSQFRLAFNLRPIVAAVQYGVDQGADGRNKRGNGTSNIG